MTHSKIDSSIVEVQTGIGRAIYAKKNEKVSLQKYPVRCQSPNPYPGPHKRKFGYPVALQTDAARIKSIAHGTV